MLSHTPSSDPCWHLVTKLLWSWRAAYVGKSQLKLFILEGAVELSCAILVLKRATDTWCISFTQWFVAYSENRAFGKIGQDYKQALACPALISHTNMCKQWCQLMTSELWIRNRLLWMPMNAGNKNCNNLNGCSCISTIKKPVGGWNVLLPLHFQ